MVANGGQELINSEKINTIPGCLTKEEVVKIVKVKPCLGLRFEPETKAEYEINNGVVLGDYIKISRPKILENEEFVIVDKVDEVNEIINLGIRMGVDVMEMDEVKQMLIDNTNFTEVYNYLLYKAVYGFINWTLNSAGIDPSEEGVVDKILSNIPAVELVKPTSESRRVKEYLGFEKNSSTIIENSTLLGMVALNNEEKDLIRQVKDPKQAVEKSARVLFAKVTNMVRNCI